MPQAVQKQFGPLRFHSGVLILILVLGTGIRLYGIGKGCFWIDEANTYHIAKLPLNEIAAKLSMDASPPLYYFILHAWMKIFGPGEIALRSLSALFGTGLIFFTCFAGKTYFSQKAGLWAAFIVAASPVQIYYSQTARMYTLLPLLSLMSVFFLAQYLNTQKWRGLVCFVAATAAAMYTHNFALYLLPLHGLLILGAGGGGSRLRTWGFVFATILLLYLPWLQIFIRQFTTPDTYTWFAEIWSKWAFHIPAYITLSSFSPAGRPLPLINIEPIPFHKLIIALFTALAAAGVWQALKSRRRLRMPGYGWVIGFLLIPPLCSLAVSFLLVPNYVCGRVDQTVFPAYALLAALGLGTLRSRAAQALVFIIILTVSVVNLQTFHPDWKTEGFRGDERNLAELLSGVLKNGDMLLCTSLSRASLEYYFERRPAKPLFYSFPRSTAAHLGGQDDAALLKDVGGLRREAEAVLEQIRLRRSRESRLFVIRVESEVNRILSEALEQCAWAALAENHGRFKQVGQDEPISLLAYALKDR